MINENQLLQLFCLNPDVAERMIQRYITTLGMNLDDKRTAVREAIFRQLLNYCELFLKHKDKELRDKFRDAYGMRCLFGQS